MSRGLLSDHPLARASRRALNRCVLLGVAALVLMTIDGCVPSTRRRPVERPTSYPDASIAGPVGERKGGLAPPMEASSSTRLAVDPRHDAIRRGSSWNDVLAMPSSERRRLDVLPPRREPVRVPVTPADVEVDALPEEPVEAISEASDDEPEPIDLTEIPEEPGEDTDAAAMDVEDDTVVLEPEDVTEEPTELIITETNGPFGVHSEDEEMPGDDQPSEDEPFIEIELTDDELAELEVESDGPTSTGGRVLDILRRAVGLGSGGSKSDEADGESPGEEAMGDSEDVEGDVEDLPEIPEEEDGAGDSASGTRGAEDERIAAAFAELRAADRESRARASALLREAERLRDAGDIEGARSRAVAASEAHPAVRADVERFLLRLASARDGGRR